MPASINHHWQISSKRSFVELKLKDVWEYRDLLVLLVRRDFVSFYKQTILGPLWFFLQPLFTTVIFTFVFGKLAGISTDGLPGPLFYMAGITAWTYFSDCFLKTSSVFRDNADIFSKVYFPRIVVPLSVVVSNLVRFTIQLLVFVAVLLYYLFNDNRVQPNGYILLFPLLVILMAAMGLGAGMTVSALTTKYRDLAFLLSFGLQLIMYATTVIVPFSAAPDKYKWIIRLNPMTPVLETFRYGFLGKGNFGWGYLAYTAAFALVILTTGVVIFTKAEKNFVDTV